AAAIMAAVTDVDRSSRTVRAERRAVEQFQRAAATVPFYKRILAKHGIRPARITDIEAFRASVPIIAKHDVFIEQPLADLLVDGALDDIVTLVTSSGVTAQSFSLGMLNRDGTRSMVQSIDRFFDTQFQINQKKTFVINTCAMGVTIPTMLPGINVSVRS